MGTFQIALQMALGGAKNHYVEHWVLDTSPQNARYLHNYLQEDMIRRIKNLAAKSHPAFLLETRNV